MSCQGRKQCFSCFRCAAAWACLVGLAWTLVTFSCASAALINGLMPGDIAIIGVYTDGLDDDFTGGGDSFAWVPLVDLAPGETIHFSDVGYYATQVTNNGFGNSEGLFTFTVPAGGIAAGTVQKASNVAAGDLSFSALGTAGTGYTTGPSAYSAGGHVSLAAGGDQLVIFQDDDISDTSGARMLFAVNTASTSWTPDDGVIEGDANQTNLYPELTNLVNAVAVGSGPNRQDEFDNVRYMGVTTGTPAELLAAIANPNNWLTINSAQTAPTRDWATNGVSQFTVIPEPDTQLLVLLGLGLVSLNITRRRPV